MRHDSDDRPAKSSRKSDTYDESYRPRPKRGNVLLYLSLVLGILVLAGGGVAAFVWPGFIKLGGDGVRTDDALGAAPADSFFVAGFRIAPPHGSADPENERDELRGLLNSYRTPKDVIELVLDAERAVIAGTIREDKPAFIMTVRLLKRWDEDRLKTISIVGPAITEDGLTYHDIVIPGLVPKEFKERLYLALPDTRTLFLGLMLKEEFIQCVKNRKNTPGMSADLLSACQKHAKRDNWIAVLNQGELKRKLGEMAQKLDPKREKEAALLANFKSATMAFDFAPKTGAKLEAAVACANAEDAETLKKLAGDGWETLMQAADALFGKAIHPDGVLLRRLAEEAKNSFQLQQNAGEVSASLSIGAAAVEDSIGRGKSMAGLVQGIMGPAVKNVREAAAKTQNLNNLKQIALAMHSYHDKYKTFPPAAIGARPGQKLLSWRVALLEFIDPQLWERFNTNEPWNSKHNLPLLKLMPEVYRNPTRQGVAPDSTNYRVFVGRGAGFEWNSGLKISDITDGLSNTLMIVDTFQSVPWTAPMEIDFDPKGTYVLGGDRDFGVAFFDASARYLPLGTSGQTLRALITCRGDDEPGPEFQR